jgi:hypothetical protein
VRLIGVARVRGKLSETPRSARATYEIQQALETQHGLKHLWTASDCRREPALELSAADSDQLTELFNSAARIPGKPLDGGDHRFVNRVGMRQAPGGRECVVAHSQRRAPAATPACSCLSSEPWCDRCNQLFCECAHFRFSRFADKMLEKCSEYCVGLSNNRKARARVRVHLRRVRNLGRYRLAPLVDALYERTSAT